MASPCAACKWKRTKCTAQCVFAPHFPENQPKRFADVQKVFGASNVVKILNEHPFNDRQDAVNSLVYEAEALLRDPVNGSVGLISTLQNRLNQVRYDVEIAKKELATYIHQPQPQPQPLKPFSSSSSAFRPYGRESNVQPKKNSTGFDTVPAGLVTVAGFNQINSGGITDTGMWSSLALGSTVVVSSSTNTNYDTEKLRHHQQQQHQEAHHHHQQHQEAHLFIPTQASQQVPVQTQEMQSQTQPNLESDDDEYRN